MKRLEIYFDSFYTEKMKEELREYGIDQYFIVPAVHSSWSKTFKHFNTHVWPGTDSILVTYLEDRHAQELSLIHIYLLQSETNLRQARVNYAQAKLNYYFLVSKYGAYLLSLIHILKMREKQDLIILR